MKLAAAFGVLGAREHAGELDLAEAASTRSRAVGASVERRLGEHDLGGRARRVRHDDRAGRPCPSRRRTRCSTLLPAVDATSTPFASAASSSRASRRRRTGRSSRAGTRGPATTSPGSRRRGVLVRRARRGRRARSAARQSVLGEPRLVVVEADVAIVDRRHRAARASSRRTPVGTSLSAGDGVRLEDARVDRARQERVVDAVEHVAQRLALGEDRLVHHRAGVAGLQHLDGDAGLLGEPLE